MIQDGSQVSIEYTLTLEDGSKVDTNVGGDPLTFTAGEQEIIPALEKEIMGMERGEEKRVMLEPEKAYGPVNPEAVEEIDAKLIPEEGRVVGAQLVARDQAGGARPVQVREVKNETVVLDLNHPLAGRTLVFDVKILGVR